MLVDLPPGQGRSRCARMFSLFWASRKDPKSEFGSDSPKAGFGPSSGNEFSSALWLLFVADTRLVGLLDYGLMALLLVPNC